RLKAFVALLALASLLTALGVAIWPSTREHYPTAKEIALEVKRINATTSSTSTVAHPALVNAPPFAPPKHIDTSDTNNANPSWPDMPEAPATGRGSAMSPLRRKP